MNDSIPQQHQSALSTRFYVSDFMHLLGRFWPILFIVPALMMSGVLYYYLTGTKYYGATSQVYMDPNFGNRISTESKMGMQPMLKDDEAALFSMEETICSDAMILRVLRKLNLLEDPSFLPKSIKKRIKENRTVTDARIVDSVRKRYGAKLINATRTLSVYVEDTEPKRAVQIAETFVEEFIAFLHEQKTGSEKELKSKLLAQAEIVKNEAIEAEKDLNKFRTKHSGFLVEQDSNLFSREMQETGSELNQTNADLIKLETLLAGLNQIDADKNPIRILNLSKGEYAVNFDDVLAQRAEALVKLQDAQARFGPSHADYRVAYNQFKSIDQSIKSHAQEIKNSTTTRQVLLKQQKAVLENEMALLRQEFNNYKAAGAEFRGLTGVVERSWNQYEKLNERILSLTSENDLNANLATPLGDPIVPFSHTKRTLISITAAAIILAAGWVVVVAAILIFKGLPFTSARQIPDLLGVPIAGCLTKQDLSKEGVLSSLPLLTGSSRVIHLTSADPRKEAASVCQMVAESYLEQGSKVTILQISDIPGTQQYDFNSEAVETFLVVPSQIEVRKLRLTIRDFLNENPNRTIIIDSTGVNASETKLALGKITNSTVIMVKENGITREQTEGWFARFKKEAGNIVALYETTSFPVRAKRKSLPLKVSRPATETFQLK